MRAWLYWTPAVTVGGASTQALTGTLFTDTATFYTGTVDVTAKTELTGTLFTNTAVFYAGTVAQSGETLLLFFQQMIGV